MSEEVAPVASEETEGLNVGQETARLAQVTEFASRVIATPTVPTNGMYELGSLSFSSPEELLEAATKICTIWKDMVEQQHLYQDLTRENKRNHTVTTTRHVLVDGWAALGQLVGVVAKEEFADSTINDTINGWTATVMMIRTRDGMVMGRGGAVCSRDEPFWANNPEYSLRSMAVTRAAGKGFRLLFGWLAKMSGYESTPYEEMMGLDAEEKLRPQLAKAPASTDPDPASGDVPVVINPQANPPTVRSVMEPWAWENLKLSYEEVGETMKAVGFGRPDIKNVGLYKAGLTLAKEKGKVPTLNEVAAYYERNHEKFQ